MPNHISNRITIHAEPERVQKILEAIKYDDYKIGSLDFNKIIPMPPELDVESGSYSNRALEFYTQYIKQENEPGIQVKLVKDYDADQQLIDFGKQLYENKQKHGHADWYGWCVANWDTKWNSYGYDENSPTYQGGNIIMFETAWSSPEAIIKRLSEMFPDVQFFHQWVDEAIGSNLGEVLYQNGDELEYDVPECYSKEAYEMYADFCDATLDEYGYYFDDKSSTYEYREDGDVEEVEPLIEKPPEKFSLRESLALNAIKVRESEQNQSQPTTKDMDDSKFRRLS